MVNGCVSSALRQVARVFQEGTFTGLSDPQILERFVDGRDEAAFEALLVRHGPMVLNVCRQLLRDPHDAEDAFQAVFLVLVRKAGSIRLHDSLGPWLYTVAGRVAARARANRRRTRAREVSGGELPESPANESGDFLDVAGVIHEELGRLPERLRAPLVLCYLEGLTHELAARQLGCPVGTVHSRLSRARGLLHKRISRRGLAVSAAALGSLLGSNAMAGVVPFHLRMSLIKAVTQWMRGSAIKGGIGISVSVATLLEGVLNVIRIKKLAMVAMGAITVGAVGLALTVAMVGRAEPPGETVPVEKELVRGIGPDGRVQGAFSAKPSSRLATMTYYVGDIVSPPAPRAKPVSPNASGPPASPPPQPAPDFKPVIELITSTVASSAWIVNDGREQQTVSKLDVGEGDRKKPIGSITPFLLSVSLIIEATPETHDQVANLLRGVRGLVDSRDRQAVAEPGRLEPSPSTLEPVEPSLRGSEEPTVLEPVEPSAVEPAEPSLRGPAEPSDAIPALPTERPNLRSRLNSRPRTSPVVPASRPRVRELLDELRQEIEKLEPGDR